MRLAMRVKTGAGRHGGLAGWLLVWLRVPVRERLARLAARLGQEQAAPRMELVEVLALGGKRQLMLVVCDGHRYLVGAGGDGVETIVPMGRPPTAEVAALCAEEAPLGQGGLGKGIRLVARPGADVGCGR
jgi:hypothetical protein